MTHNDLTLLRGAAANALLKKIGPNIRAVFTAYGPDEVCLLIYHEGELTPEEKQSFEDAASIMPIHLSQNLRTYCTTSRLDPPTPLPKMGNPIYIRQGERSARSKFDLSYLRLNTIKALLGLVTPPLREVQVGLCHKKIMLYCYFHNEVTPTQRKDMEAVAKRIEATFPSDYSMHLIIERLDAPQRSPDRGYRVYSRRERPFPISGGHQE